MQVLFIDKIKLTSAPLLNFSYSIIRFILFSKYYS